MALDQRSGGFFFPPHQGLPNFASEHGGTMVLGGEGVYLVTSGGLTHPVTNISGLRVGEKALLRLKQGSLPVVFEGSATLVLTDDFLMSEEGDWLLLLATSNTVLVEISRGTYS